MLGLQDLNENARLIVSVVFWKHGGLFVTSFKVKKKGGVALRRRPNVEKGLPGRIGTSGTKKTI